MIVIVNALMVLGFPALAVWALHRGGRRSVWLAAGWMMAALAILGLALASAGLGNRLSAHQGYGKTAMLILVMVAIVWGPPVLAAALTVLRAGSRTPSPVVVYLLAVGAAFLALLVGTGLVVRLLPVLV